MILNTTTKKLQIVLTAAKTTTDMSVSVDWADITATTITAGNTPSLSNGTTVSDILAAPAASTERKINSIVIYNADTASKTVHVILNDNGTSYTLVSATLSAKKTASKQARSAVFARCWYSLSGSAPVSACGYRQAAT